MSSLRGIFGDLFGPVATRIVDAAAGAETGTTSSGPSTTSPATTTATATTTSGGLSSFTDEFSGDMSAWNQTHMIGTQDITVSDGSARLTAASWASAKTLAMHALPLASADHKVQITESALSGGYDAYNVLFARADAGSGVPSNAYLLEHHHAEPIWRLKRRVGGVETLLASGSPWGSYGDPGYTWRLSVSGTGSTVTLEVWSSVEGTTHATYEDTSEDRIVSGAYVGWAAGCDDSNDPGLVAIDAFHAEVL